MLRSHSHYCSGLQQQRLAIVNLLCKFLAVVIVHVLKTLAAAIYTCHSSPKLIIAIVPDTFKRKKEAHKIPRINSVTTKDSKAVMDASMPAVSGALLFSGDGHPCREEVGTPSS